jgi:uncharacterized membrane protein YedE/YeeE
LTGIKPPLAAGCLLGFVKTRTLRRVIGAVAIVGGALLMWLSPEVLAGALVMGAGIALEIVGIALERK